MGVPQAFVEVFEYLYENVNIQFELASGRTKSITFKRGTIQDPSTSTPLLPLAFEPLFRGWEHATSKVSPNLTPSCFRGSQLATFFVSDASKAQDLLQLVRDFEDSSGIKVDGSSSRTFVYASKGATLNEWTGTLPGALNDNRTFPLDGKPSEHVFKVISSAVQMRWDPHRQQLSLFERTKAINQQSLVTIWSALDCIGLLSPTRLAKAFKDAIQPHLMLQDSGVWPGTP